MEEENTEEPGTFSIFFAEGESLAKQGEYLKAIESFTKVGLLCSLDRPSCPPADVYVDYS